MALFIKLVIGDVTFDFAGGAITSCSSWYGMFIAAVTL
jgi:hypothetical protein